ncbi:MAG: hypothetical protein ABI876_16295, partial [Bacteroidota bacterium]
RGESRNDNAITMKRPENRNAQEPWHSWHGAHADPAYKRHRRTLIQHGHRGTVPNSNTFVYRGHRYHYRYAEETRSAALKILRAYRSSPGAARKLYALKVRKIGLHVWYLVGWRKRPLANGRTQRRK